MVLILILFFFTMYFCTSVRPIQLPHFINPYQMSFIIKIYFLGCCWFKHIIAFYLYSCIVQSSIIVIAVWSANCASVSVKPIANCFWNCLNIDVNVHSLTVFFLFFLFSFHFYLIRSFVIDAHKTQQYCACNAKPK